jgi:hypothetical protein
MYIYDTDMKTVRSHLQANRRSLIRQIPNLDPWIEGTLVTTSRKCGKDNCTCHHQGPKHPVLFVTWKEAGKTVSLYIPRQLEAEVKQWTENYKKLKALIRQISEVQKQIVRLRE